MWISSLQSDLITGESKQDYQALAVLLQGGSREVKRHHPEDKAELIHLLAHGRTVGGVNQNERSAI
jgi:hypothetical protein